MPYPPGEPALDRPPPVILAADDRSRFRRASESDSRSCSAPLEWAHVAEPPHRIRTIL